ncbi:MAG TPA: iron-sulfur cluster assembly scaffold protein [Thermodesulfobacteriota bacterium]
MTYGAALLSHYRAPRNFGALEDADATHEELNPLCGDRIRMSVRVRDGRLDAVRFRGDACAIAVASASILTELVTGLAASQAEAIGDAAVLPALETDIPPSRLPCVRLPIEALRGALRLTLGAGNL